jgi:hypothetical protein
MFYVVVRDVRVIRARIIIPTPTVKARNFDAYTKHIHSPKIFTAKMEGTINLRIEMIQNKLKVSTTIY